MIYDAVFQSQNSDMKTVFGLKVDNVIIYDIYFTLQKFGKISNFEVKFRTLPSLITKNPTVQNYCYTQKTQFKSHRSVSNASNLRNFVCHSQISKLRSFQYLRNVTPTRPLFVLLLAPLERALKCGSYTLFSFLWLLNSEYRWWIKVARGLFLYSDFLNRRTHLI